MLISSVNSSQGWTLSECAIIPHWGGDEIAWEAEAGVGKSKGDWVEMGRNKGQRNPSFMCLTTLGAAQLETESSAGQGVNNKR